MKFNRAQLFKLKKALLKLSEIATEEGVTLVIDEDELTTGIEAFVNGDEGLVPASDGIYNYGNQVITVEGGIITVIAEKGVETEPVAEEPTEEVVVAEEEEKPAEEEEKPAEEEEKKPEEEEEIQTEEETPAEETDEKDARIAELEARIAELEAENAELKAKLEEPVAESVETEMKRQNKDEFAKERSYDYTALRNAINNVKENGKKRH